MSPAKILIAVKSLKTKNCFGHDCLPLRIIIVGTDILIRPLSLLSFQWNSRAMAYSKTNSNLSKGWQVQNWKLLSEFKPLINFKKFLRNKSLIARAVDDDMSVLMASLDLSAAFDVVNVELLLKRLTIVGLPSDVVELISIWLKSRYFYISIEGENSLVH